MKTKMKLYEKINQVLNSNLTSNDGIYIVDGGTSDVRGTDMPLVYQYTRFFILPLMCNVELCYEELCGGDWDDCDWYYDTKIEQLANAPQEVRDKREQAIEMEFDLAAEREFAHYQEEAEKRNDVYRAYPSTKGDLVEIVGSRKYKGLVGVVKWIGRNSYAHQYEYRSKWAGCSYSGLVLSVLTHYPFDTLKAEDIELVGIKVDGRDKLIYVDSAKCKLLSEPQHLISITLEDVRNHIKRMRRNMHSLRGEY
jgi:hypothetical protein